MILFCWVALYSSIATTNAIAGFVEDTCGANKKISRGDLEACMTYIMANKSGDGDGGLAALATRDAGQLALMQATVLAPVRHYARSACAAVGGPMAEGYVPIDPLARMRRPQRFTTNVPRAILQKDRTLT